MFVGTNNLMKTKEQLIEKIVYNFLNRDLRDMDTLDFEDCTYNSEVSIYFDEELGEYLVSVSSLTLFNDEDIVVHEVSFDDLLEIEKEVSEYINPN